MRPTVRPSATVLSDKRLPGGPPPSVLAAGVITGFALLRLLAASPALALVGFFAGSVCLTAVLKRR